MPRLTCSTFVLTALFSWWILTSIPSRSIRAAEAPAENDPPFVAKVQALLADKSVQRTEGDDEEKKLLKERCVVAVTLVQASLQRCKGGANPLTPLLQSIEQLHEARRELDPKSENPIPFLEVYFEVAKDDEKRAEARHKATVAGLDVVAAARYARLTAQLRLLRAKRQQKSAGSK